MRKYKITDLCTLTLLFCLLEAASAWALSIFPGEVYTVSFVLFGFLLITMRWGAAGTAFAALGGAVYCFLHGATPLQYAVYMAGNSFAAVNLLWMKNPEKIRKSPAYTALFCSCGYVSMCLGRSAVSWAAGQGFWFVRFLAVDALSAVVTLALLFIARGQNGLFEPQREYLIRLKREEENQKYGG